MSMTFRLSKSVPSTNAAQASYPMRCPGKSREPRTESRIFDEDRAKERLVLSYDSTAEASKGTVENTTMATLSRVRLEVHLSKEGRVGSNDSSRSGSQSGRESHSVGRHASEDGVCCRMFALG